MRMAGHSYEKSAALIKINQEMMDRHANCYFDMMYEIADMRLKAIEETDGAKRELLNKEADKLEAKIKKMNVTSEISSRHFKEIFKAHAVDSNFLSKCTDESHKIIVAVMYATKEIGLSDLALNDQASLQVKCTMMELVEQVAKIQTEFIRMASDLIEKRTALIRSNQDMMEKHEKRYNDLFIKISDIIFKTVVEADDAKLMFALEQFEKLQAMIKEMRAIDERSFGHCRDLVLGIIGRDAAGPAPAGGAGAQVAGIINARG